MSGFSQIKMGVVRQVIVMDLVTQVEDLGTLGAEVAIMKDMVVQVQLFHIHQKIWIIDLVQSVVAKIIPSIIGKNIGVDLLAIIVYY